LLSQSADRLRILARLYRFVFFMAGLLPALLFDHDRAKLLSSALLWAPGVVLAKDPAGRPQSARELSRRLAEVAGSHAWTEDRARDWWTQHRPE
jgi:hypothetical protein